MWYPHPIGIRVRALSPSGWAPGSPAISGQLGDWTSRAVDHPSRRRPAREAPIRTSNHHKMLDCCIEYR
ncbi:hypothetical protein BDP67DRAFT_532629 [Colletotrichum lupini]|nr:hypothetical protein BDP67DRAFT_532629 [Colletotrichum lupini]